MLRPYGTTEKSGSVGVLSNAFTIHPGLKSWDICRGAVFAPPDRTMFCPYHQRNQLFSALFSGSHTGTLYITSLHLRHRHSERMPESIFPTIEIVGYL